MNLSTVSTPVIVLIAAAAGGLAGGAGRWLLGRIRRGATVHRGWCEAGVALLWAVLAWRVHAGELPVWWLPVPLLVTWFAVVLTVTDLKHRRLPDALTLPAYPLVVAGVLAAAVSGGGWPLAFGASVGALAFFCVYAAVHLTSPHSLGPGDVKLSGSVGVVLGAVGWPAMVVASGVAAVVTLVLRLLAPRRLARRWRRGIPHGPGLLSATCLVAVFPGSFSIGAS